MRHLAEVKCGETAEHKQHNKSKNVTVLYSVELCFSVSKHFTPKNVFLTA